MGRVVHVPVVGASFRVAPRSVAVGLALVVVALALLVVAVGTGEYSIPPGLVIETLLGGGDAGTSFVIETLRLPRALTALLVGAGLGAAGAIFQSVVRNPLGSPDVVGFTAGASAGAVLEIAVIGGGSAAVAAGALVGGAGTAVLVYLLAFRGGVQGYRLVLVGIGLSAMLVAVRDYLITRTRLEEAQTANVWITGSLNGRGWEHVVPMAIALAVLLPLVALLARSLRMLELGDDAAHALGVPVARARTALLGVGVALTAVATAAAGPVLFVALAAPQIARRLTRASGPGVGTAALMGATLLLAADVAAQRVFPGTDLPVGVLTGVLGGAYLIWLLFHEWRSARA
nr:iron chelate uptake ABC transporter family permease subunit [Patulibacter sp. SYSU D01012]